jgi:3-dehydroquinate synthase
MQADQTKISYIDLEGLRESLAKLDTDTIVILTEPNVWSHYGSEFNSFEFEGKTIYQYKLPSGEDAKALLEYERCLQFLISKKVHRNTHILAVGGGALSDSAGFVASTYLRGVDWSVVPTSLLSMVDACLGGKVAINVNETKNMVGSFHHPRNIFINFDFLKTLPREEIKSALGEVVKYALLDPKICAKLLADDPLDDIISKCLEYKRKIVIEDPEEKELRRLLNLGHTLGHAIENFYGLAHGTSVFWGMLVESIIFESHKALEKLALLNKKLDITNGEPPWLNRTFPMDDLLLFVKSDKKVVSNKVISLPIVREDEVKIENISLEDLEEKLSYKIEFIRTYKL